MNNLSISKMEPKVLFSVLTVYRERGNYLRRLEQFEKAKTAYDEAMLYYPEDVRLLIGRSQACADAVKPLDAYKNAERALEIEPDNMNARNVQARALYTITEFERALTKNIRGARKRTKPAYFLEGTIQSKETIEDCIGINAGPFMKDFLPLIKKNVHDVPDEHTPEVKPRVSRIPHPKHYEKQSQATIRKQLRLSRVLALKYLGPMAKDKAFLQKLSKDPRLQGANKKTSAELKQIVLECLAGLSERQEMLRAQRPYYSVKWAERSESSRLTKFKQDLLAREREINTAIAHKRILSIEKIARERKMMILMSQAERFQKFLDSKSERNLPDKDIFIDRLYKAVGLGYYSMHRISYRLNAQQNRARIAFLMGLSAGRPKSYDSVRAEYPYRNIVDLKEATMHVIHALDACENSYMQCWLMYEAACLLNRQKNYALAKYYAKKLQFQAHKLNNPIWWVNGCYALVYCDMQQKNLNEVRVLIEEANAYFKENYMQHSEAVQVFLAQCLALANEPISSDDDKIGKKRQADILKIMDNVTKEDARLLFKNISSKPPGRQFKVIPMKKTVVSKEAERKRYRQCGLSIVPGKEKGIRRVPHSGIPGYQIFER